MKKRVGNTAHIADWGVVVYQLRISVSQFRLIGTGMLAEIPRLLHVPS